MSAVIGGVFGFLLLFWALIAGVDMVQVIAVHNTLAFATQQAVRQESVSGCWTSMTTQAAVNTLDAQNVPASSVTVTQYSAAPGAPYGSTVVVSLTVPDQVALLGMKTPMVLTVAASDTATSQWVPTAGVTSNSACNPPTTLQVGNGAAQTTSGGGPYNGY